MFANGGKNNERPVQRTIGWTDTAGALFLRRFRFEFELRDFGGGGGGGRFFFCLGNRGGKIVSRNTTIETIIIAVVARSTMFRICRLIDRGRLPTTRFSRTVSSVYLKIGSRRSIRNPRESG